MIQIVLPSESMANHDLLATQRSVGVFSFGRTIGFMGTARKPSYSVYVVLLDEYVSTLPQMRRRNDKRDPSKPYVYIGLTLLRLDRRFDFRKATNKHEWRLHRFGVRLMPELYDSLQPMTCTRALQAAKKLADDLRAKGFGVANGICTEAQAYKSILTQRKKAA